MKRSWCVFLGIFTAVLVVIFAVPKPPALSPPLVLETEAAWQEYMRSHTAEESYRQFRFMHAGESFRLHSQAHIFGSALFEVYSDTAMAVCDDSFHGGCTHGYITRLLETRGIDALEDYANLCIQPRMGMQANCEHSFGHALVYVYGYTEADLIRALGSCEEKLQKTPERFDGEECYHGAFMEYNQKNTEHLDALTVRTLDADRPYEPCDWLSDRYKKACYHRLTRLWSLTKGLAEDDMSLYARLGEWCQNIPDRTYLKQCQNGVQTTITTYFGVDDVAYARALCSAAFLEPTQRSSCDYHVTEILARANEKVF